MLRGRRGEWREGWVGTREGWVDALMSAGCIYIRFFSENACICEIYKIFKWLNTHSVLESMLKLHSNYFRFHFFTVAGAHIGWRTCRGSLTISGLHILEFIHFYILQCGNKVLIDLMNYTKWILLHWGRLKKSLWIKHDYYDDDHDTRSCQEKVDAVWSTHVQ